MDKQLYIKTDGPIPEGCNHFTITAGKVYEAYDICMERHFCSAISDTGSMLRIDLKRGCPCELCQLKWHFCDQHGNPVPAPWESTKRPKLRGEEGDLCACHDSPEWNVASWKIAICEHPEYSEKDGLCLRCDHARKCHEEGFYSPQESINYRAHAEALAEALWEAVGALHNVRAVSHMCDECVSFETARVALNRNRGFVQVLAAYEAAAAQAVPDGWKLVPVEPTDEMLRCAQKEWLADPLRRSTTLYRAMLNAAPAPEGGEP